MIAHVPGKPWTVEQLADRWDADVRLVGRMILERRVVGFKAGREWRVTEAALAAYELGAGGNVTDGAP